MMDCCVRQREIEGERTGEGIGGKTRAFYREGTARERVNERVGGGVRDKEHRGKCKEEG